MLNLLCVPLSLSFQTHIYYRSTPCWSQVWLQDKKTCDCTQRPAGSLQHYLKRRKQTLWLPEGDAAISPFNDQLGNEYSTDKKQETTVPIHTLRYTHMYCTQVVVADNWNNQLQEVIVFLNLGCHNFMRKPTTKIKCWYHYQQSFWSLFLSVHTVIPRSSLLAIPSVTPKLYFAQKILFNSQWLFCCCYILISSSVGQWKFILFYF